MNLNIAISYGGRWDLEQALKKIIDDILKETIKIKNLNEDLISNYLSTSQIKDPDMIIRSGGEKRISNFFLWQAAYSEIYFDNNPPPSILQINGAKSIAVEFTSMSKTYAMPGWRIGFAVGNERIISALIRVKSYLDYGAYTPIQVAAAAALNGPQDCIEEIRLCYKSRRDILIKSFANSGWNIPEPQSSMFAWAPIPEQFKDLGSVEFSKLLLSEAQIAVSPGVAFGEHGDGHVTVSLVEKPQFNELSKLQ